METAALIIAIILFVAGILGTVLPFLPGAALIYIGMLIYGIMTKFVALDWMFFIIQAVLLIFVFLVDYWATAFGTKRFGGSKQAAWGAIIGTIAGIFFGPLGIIIGPFLGAVIAEIIRGTEFKQTIRVGIGTIVGFLGGSILKIAVELVMIIYFFVKL